MALSYEKFTKDIGLVGLTQLLLKLKGIILLPIIAKSLGVFQYGIWAQISITISLFAPLVTLGLMSGIMRFLASEKNKKMIQDGLYSSIVIIFFSGVIISLLFYFSSDYLSEFLLHTPIIAPIIKLASFGILITALDQLLLAFYRTRREITKYSFFIILESFCEIGLTVFLISLGWGLIGVIVPLIIIRILSFEIMLTFVIIEYGIKLPNFSHIKSYLLFGIPLLPSFVFGWIIGSSDRYLIGYFMDNSSVGVYSAAYMIGEFILFFIAPISIVLYPTIINLWEDKKIDQVKKYLHYSIKYFFMLAIPSAVGLSILSKQILKLFTTSQFVEGSIIIPIIAISQLFYGLYLFNMYILAVVKKTKRIGLLLGFSAALNIVINVILIPLVGILGAGISTIISMGILCILTYYFAIKNIWYIFGLNEIMKMLFASMIMAFFIIAYNPLYNVDIFICIILAILIYFSLLLILKVFSKNELYFLKRLLRKKRPY